jgi:Aspartyl protease
MHAGCGIRRTFILLVALAALVLPAAARNDSAIATTPFAFVHHEILVDVRIGNSGPYTFLLDTDTTPSVIDLALAKRLGLRFNGAPGSGGGVGGGHVIVYPLVVPNVQFGTLRIQRLDALATYLSQFSTLLGRRIDGVLGSSFFAGRVVQIDYPCKAASVLSDARLQPFTAHFIQDASGNDLSGDVWIGPHRVRATFDTGDSGYSFVSRKGIGDLHLERTAKKGKVSLSMGYLGLARETEGTLTSVHVGRVWLGSVRTRFLQSFTDVYDVNLGNQVMQRFVVTFDYVRGLLTLDRPHSCARR